MDICANSDLYSIGGLSVNKRNRTHELIKENLLTLLAKQKLSDITVYDICDSTFITRSTFYNHYKDKFHVLESINEDFCLKIKDHLNLRFNSVDIEPLLIDLIDNINKEFFLIMIDIQEENVNLRKDIQLIFENTMHNHLISNRSNRRPGTSDLFIEKLFSSIAMTFLEYSTKYGQTEENARLLNDLNSIFQDYCF